MSIPFGPQPGTQQTDAISVHHFGLEVQGLVSGFFTDCSSIDSETTPIDFYQNSDRGTPHLQKVPGNAKWSDVTLKRGMTQDNSLFEWRHMVIDGQIEKARRDATVTGYSPDGTPVIQYVLTRAWPRKYTGATFDAKASTAGVEQIVLAHEGARRTK